MEALLPLAQRVPEAGGELQTAGARRQRSGTRCIDDSCADRFSGISTKIRLTHRAPTPRLCEFRTSRPAKQPPISEWRLLLPSSSSRLFLLF